jgi:hypothetical protein
VYEPFRWHRAVGSLCFLTFASALLIGCSKSDRDAGTVPVSGKATYNGQPLADATVTLMSDESNSPGAATTKPDGTFQLRVKPGRYTATLSKLNMPTDTREVSMEEAMANTEKPPEEPKETLPAKYQNLAESPFKIEVKASGENKLDLTIND